MIIQITHVYCKQLFLFSKVLFPWTIKQSYLILEMSYVNDFDKILKFNIFIQVNVNQFDWKIIKLYIYYCILKNYTVNWSTGHKSIN